MSVLRTLTHLPVITGRISFPFVFKHLSCCGVSPVFNISSYDMDKTARREFRTSSSQFSGSKEIVSKMSRADITNSDFFIKLKNLQSKVNQNKKIYLLEVESVFSAIKTQAPLSITSLQGLLLIRCCGYPLSEVENEDRSKLVQNIWETLHSLQCPMDVSHYNTLLKVYIENEYAFDPKDFLNKMDQANIVPDVITYRHLVCGYCQIGQINCAREILDVIKSKNMGITADMYSDLIIGHARSNRIDEMTSVLDDMRRAHLSPNSSTYTALACGYAIQGDIKRLLSAIQQAENNDLRLSNKELLNIIYTLAVNKHGHLTEQVISRLQHNKQRVQEDYVNVILELVNKGYHEIGFNLLVRMFNGSAGHSGDLYIEQIVKKNLPPGLVMDYCEKFKKAGLNEFAWLKATKEYMLANKTDDAMMFIQKLPAEVLSRLQFNQENQQKFLNVIRKFPTKGYHEIVFNLLIKMPRADGSKRSSFALGDNFIQQIVRKNLPPDVVIQYCDKLKEAGVDELALLKAAKVSMTLHKTDDAIMFLRKLHSQAHALRPHFFWPIFMSKKNGGEKDILDLVKVMLALNCPADFETFISYVFPNIDISNPSAVIIKVKDMGYDVDDPAKALCTFLLKGGKIKEVIRLLEDFPDLTNVVGIIMQGLPKLCLESLDMSSILQLLELSQNRISADDAVKDIHGEYLTNLISTGKYDSLHLESLLTGMEKKNFKIAEATAEHIIKVLGNKCSNKISSILRRMSSSQVPSSNPARSIEKLRYAPVEALTAYLSEHKTSDETMVQILHSLLVINTHLMNLEHVKVLIRHFEEVGIPHSEKSCTALVKFYCNLEDLDKSMHYKKLLDETFPENKLPSFWTLRLVKFLVSNKKFQDAEQMIHKHHRKLGEAEKKMNTLLAFQILTGFMESDDVKHPQKILEMFMRFGYCTVDNRLFGPLVGTYISRGNVIGAVNEFLRIAKEYHCTPSQFMLFKALIISESIELLQKVIDAAVEIHGEANVLFNLASVLITCGQHAQAKQVLETPGLQTTMEKIKVICSSFVDRDQVDDLEIFLELSKNVFGLNRDYMYYELLRGFAQRQNLQKVLGVMEKMQEEGVVPSNQTLHLLGTFLQKMNQPVPFNIPSDSDPLNTKFVEMLTKGDIDGAMNIYESENLNVQDGSARLNDLCQLIELVLDDNRLEDAVKVGEGLFCTGNHPSPALSRKMAIKFSEAGDKVSVLWLKKKLPFQVSKWMPFISYVAVAMINSGRLEEFLKSLETETDKYNRNFPDGALLCALSTNPDILSRVRNIAHMYYHNGLVTPRNILWVYLMTNKRFEEAESIFKFTPEMHSNLDFENVSDHIKIHGDLEASYALLNQTRNTSLSLKAKGKIYSGHINVLLSHNKLDEAMRILTESEELLGLTHIQVGALFRLKKHLEDAGKEVPFEVPMR